MCAHYMDASRNIQGKYMTTLCFIKVTYYLLAELDDF